MARAIRFGEIRDYCCRFDRISVCMSETLRYENFRFISEVPHSYDECYLYGFGLRDSEFDDDVTGETKYMTCMEIMLSEKPRDDL